MNNLDFESIIKYVNKHKMMPDNISINVLSENQIMEVMKIIPECFDDLTFNNITNNIWLLAGKLNPEEYLEIIPKGFITKEYLLSLLEEDSNIINYFNDFYISTVKNDLINYISFKKLEHDTWKKIIPSLIEFENFETTRIELMPKDLLDIYFIKRIEYNVENKNFKMIPEKYINEKIISTVLSLCKYNFFDFFSMSILNNSKYTEIIVNKFPNLIEYVSKDLIKNFSAELIETIYNYNFENYKYLPEDKIPNTIKLDYALNHNNNYLRKIPVECFSLLNENDAEKLLNLDLYTYINYVPLELVTEESFKKAIEKNHNNIYDLSRISKKFINQEIFEKYPLAFKSHLEIVNQYINENTIRKLYKQSLLSNMFSSLYSDTIKKYLNVIIDEIKNDNTKYDRNNCNKLLYYLIYHEFINEDCFKELTINNPYLIYSISLKCISRNHLDLIVGNNPNFLIEIFQDLDKSYYSKIDKDSFIKDYVHLYSTLDGANFSYIPEKYIDDEVFENIYTSNPRSIVGLKPSKYTSHFYEIAAAHGAIINTKNMSEELKEIAIYNKEIIKKIEKLKKQNELLQKYSDSILKYLSGKTIGIESFCFENKLPVSEFKKTLEFLRNNIPNIDEICMDISSIHKNEGWKYMQSITLDCIEGMNNGVECPANGDFVSFNPVYYFLTTNANPYDIYNTLQKINATPRQLKEFKNKVIKYSKNSDENIQQFMEMKISNESKNTVLTNFEKEKIISFMKNNNIPINTYNLLWIVDAYYKNQININEIYKKKFEYTLFEEQRDLIAKKIETIKFQEITINFLEKKLKELQESLIIPNGGRKNV